MSDSYIPVTDAPLRFTPPALFTKEETVDGKPVKIAADTDPVFLIKPCTVADFDQLGFELFRHNIVPPSNETYRALVIDECFKLYDDDKAEETVALFDEYWLANDTHREQMEMWTLQDQQRRRDIGMGAPASRLQQEALPTHTMSARRRSQATLALEAVRKDSRPLRDLTVDMQTYGGKQRAALARLVILGWEHLKAPFAREDGIVNDETYQAMAAEIGKDALAELETYALAQGALPPAEVGNSASPLATAQMDALSPAPNGASEANTSTLTSAADTAPSSSGSGVTHADGYAATTIESSTSTLPSAGASESTDAIRPAPSPEPQPG